MALDATDLAEALEDGLLVISRGGQVHTVNGAAERLLGRPRRESLNRPLTELPLGPALASPVAEAWLRGAEVRATVHDRCGHLLAVRVVPREQLAWVFLRSVAGQVERLGPTPPATHEYLRTVLRHAPLVLFSYDAAGILTISEGRGLERLGLSPGQAAGRSIFELHADTPWILDSARRALAGERVSVVGAIGDAVFDVHYGPLHGDDGRVDCVIGVAVDISDRARASEQLGAQQSLLKYILAHIPQAIFWKDRRGRFLGCNQQFLSHTGFSSQAELVGRADRDLWRNGEEAEFFEAIDQRVMTTGAPILNIEESLLQRDGRQTYLLTSKVPIRDERGEVTGILGIFVDITERKRIELELQTAKEAADAALRAKTEFLTVMSHELRTPLTLVLGPLEALLTTAKFDLTERVHAALATIWRNAARLGRLVDDILDFHKIEAGKIAVTWEPVDVRALVEDIVRDAEATAASAGLALRLDLAGDVRTVPLDRRKFEKIVLNLLGNALKFTPAGGTVTVQLARSPAGLELAVDDTGPGIAAEEHARVFQRFQQLDSSTSRKHEGTGLGLAIVRDFAERMGGTVSLRSQPGVGSRFTVALPIDPDRLVGPAAPARPSAPPHRHIDAPRPRARAPEQPGERPCVLVVEDNPDMRGYLEEIVGDEFAVASAATGAAALHALRELRPAAIVSDIMMPEMDGYELVARLKADPQWREIPVILLSARAGPDQLVHGLDAGADDYLPKPFRPDELRARVRAAIRLHRSHLEVRTQKEALERALRSLEHAQEQLVQSSKMAAIGTLIAGLSHELNNPIAIICMSTQMLLRRGTRDPLVRRTLERVERHAQRAARLVSTLLAYTRERPPLAERCELGPILLGLLDLVRPEADERGLKLVAAFVAGELPAIVVPCPALESALLHVLRNATDASRRGDTIELAARAQAGDDGTPGVEIVVRDQGAGIAPADLPHVFEAFFTTKAPGRGTGLGLPMTYKFVDSQGGTMHLDSELGRGTSVQIWLPLVGAGEAAPDQRAEGDR